MWLKSPEIHAKTDHGPSRARSLIGVTLQLRETKHHLSIRTTSTSPPGHSDYFRKRLAAFTTI